ncbi:MAG: phasin family protein [Terriglobales bacterium]
MTAKIDNLPTGLDRLNALLAWWAIPSGTALGNMEKQTKRFQVLVTDLSQAFSDASSCQAKTINATNGQLARSLQDLLHSRQPQELMAAQLSVVADLLESLAAQTKTWADLTQKVHGCCATMVRETAEEVAKQVGGAAPAKAQSEPERSAGKETGK